MDRAHEHLRAEGKASPFSIVAANDALIGSIGLNSFDSTSRWWWRLLGRCVGPWPRGCDHSTQSCDVVGL